MGTNFRESGASLPLTAPSGGVVSGSVYKIGLLICVAAVTAAEGESFTAHVEGVWEVVKNAGEAWTEGALIYWDDTNKEFTTTSTSNTLAGHVTEAALSAAVVGKIRLSN